MTMLKSIPRIAGTIFAGVAACLALSVDAARGQVVQLPTFQYFTVNTTVSVPDSGRGFIGGVKRARASRTSRGVPIVGKVPGLGRLANNRGIGSDMSATGASVTARIIDHSELDAATLAMARSQPGLNSRTAAQAGYLASNLAVHNAPPAAPIQPSVAAPRIPTAEQIRQANELSQRRRGAEVNELIAKGKRAESENKLGAARIYYKMAAKRASGQLKQYIVDHIAELGRPARADAKLLVGTSPSVSAPAGK